MPVKVVQFAQPHHDAVDEDFRAAFPGVDFVKVDSVTALARELPGAAVLTMTNPWYDAQVAALVAERGSALRWIQFATVGIDAAVEAGLPGNVAITNVRGVRTGILSAHAIALMLAVMRGLNQYKRFRARHEWAREDMFPYVVPPEEGTLVLCGMGAIGRDIARKARTFDMKIIGVSRAGQAGGDFDEVVPRERLNEVLPRADVLMLALPYDSATHHMIGAEQFALMKKSAVLVNIARGGIVDEAAMIAALQGGKILGAGLDVYEVEPLPPESPLWDLENVVMEPHLAGQGGDAQRRRLRELFEDNMRRFLAGERLRNRVGPDGDQISD